MKRKNGVWYYCGRAYATFRDALRAAWPRRYGPDRERE